MGKTKKQTKAQIKAKAAAAAKQMTMGKVNKLVAVSGGAIEASLLSMNEGNFDNLPRRVVRTYSGIDIRDGSVDITRAAKGVGGPVFNKLERAIFKGLNVPAPSVRRKGIKSKIGVAVYYGASVANAMGGSDNLEKFRRYYHSQYGVDMRQDGMACLDYSKPIVEKIIPYIVVNKVMSWAMK